MKFIPTRWLTPLLALLIPAKLTVHESPSLKMAVEPLSNGITYRQLLVDDWKEMKENRLESLLDSPAAFGGSFEEESIKEDDYFKMKLANNVIFGAFKDGKLAGTVGFMRHNTDRYRHRGKIFGVYTTPSARGLGISRKLMEMTIEYAKTVVVWVELQVWTENPGALAMYTKLGFIVYGTEFRSLVYDDNKYADYYCMMLNVDK